MNRLQKNAWLELGVVAVCILIGSVCFKFMVASNTQGMTYVVITIVVGCIVGPPVAYFSYKDECKYDEREKAIRRKAFSWSAGAMMIFLILSCFIPFFLIGGAGSMPVYYLPMIFWGCLLVAQVVMSSVIIFKCVTDTL